MSYKVEASFLQLKTTGTVTLQGAEHFTCGQENVQDISEECTLMWNTCTVISEVNVL